MSDTFKEEGTMPEETRYARITYVPLYINMADEIEEQIIGWTC
jgi:hypothetical protein